MNYNFQLRFQSRHVVGVHRVATPVECENVEPSNVHVSFTNWDNRVICFTSLITMSVYDGWQWRVEGNFVDQKFEILQREINDIEGIWAVKENHVC